MKTSLSDKLVFESSLCLSADQLRLYSTQRLPAKETRVVEEHLADCMLCSAAAEGFVISAVSENELTDLHKRVDSASGASWFTTANRMILFLLAAALLTTAAIWFLNRDPKLNQDSVVVSGTQSLVTSATSDSAPVSTRSDSGLTPLNREHPDKFVEPLSSSTRKLSQVKADPQPRKIQQKPGTEEMPKATADPINQVPVLEKVDPVEEVVVQPTYNAPTQYIYSLKVTDLAKLYVAPNNALRISGTPAQSESGKAGADGTEDQKETVHAVSAEEVLKSGLFSFRNAHYETAQGRFLLLCKQNENDANAFFYSAMSYFYLKKADKSIAAFDKVLSMQNNVFREEAMWYKAQELILKNDREEAQKLLNLLIAEKGFYAREAKKLQATLR
jgi:tetratricopeptide (TPR) repeat protein